MRSRWNDDARCTHCTHRFPDAELQHRTRKKACAVRHSLEYRVGYLRLSSEHSKAAVRALLATRQESEADLYWDEELDCSGLADSIKAARERAEREEVRAD